MPRKLKVRLLGAGWVAYGGYTIPEDRIVLWAEDDAAEFLRHRGAHRSVEFLGWVDEDDEDTERSRPSN